MSPSGQSLATCVEAEILAEERHYMVLEAACYSAGMGAWIDLEAVRDSVLVEDIMKLGRGLDVERRELCRGHGHAKNRGDGRRNLPHIDDSQIAMTGDAGA
jgi:hypothetical protein